MSGRGGEKKGNFNESTTKFSFLPRNFYANVKTSEQGGQFRKIKIIKIAFTT